jgi:hypothetical protein
MAVDTKLKRASAVHVGLPWRGLFPIESDEAISYTYVLDTLDNLYGVYSLKALASGGGNNLVRVRRDSDNVEADFAGNLAVDGWIDAAAITTWLNGANGYVCRLYDQSGNDRDAIQEAAADQPILSLGGTHPCLDFETTGFIHWLHCPGAQGFAQNIGAASMIGVRRHESNTGENVVVTVNLNIEKAAATGRMTMRTSTGNVHQVAGRREDGDASDGPTGFAENTNWAVQIGRWDFANATLEHDLDASNETDATFHDAGNTPDQPGDVSIGASIIRTVAFDGQMTCVALVQDLLTDLETAALITDLADLKL